MNNIEASDVTESLRAISETYRRDSPSSSVAVVDGYGLRVEVERGHLELADGLGEHRRVRRYAKATHGLSRLVIIGSTGFVSLKAMRWCASTGVGLVVLDPSDGSVLTTSGFCAVDDGRLRRSQALAPITDTGLAVARFLIAQKLDGQASVAETELGALDAGATIRRLQAELKEIRSIEEIRQLEAAAANTYWHAWEMIRLTFTKKDVTSVPDYWKIFEGRRSAINPGTARSATDPLNSILNYSYRLVEAECRLATLAIGLDPGLGIMHADMRNRDGFVLDLMEVARPVAERFVARLAREHAFQKRDFVEDERGVVRVLAPLSHRLVEAMPAFSVVLATVVEQVAQMLGEASPYDVSAPAVLSRSKHRESARRKSNTTSFGGPNAEGYQTRKKTRQKPVIGRQAALPQAVCRNCGSELKPRDDMKRSVARYCSVCIAERRHELGKEIQVLPAVRGVRTPEAAELQRTRNAEVRLTEQQWEMTNSDKAFDRERFLREVAPNLASVTLTTIAKATGMSTSAASQVRSGKRVPHPRHWAALEEIAAGHS